MPDLPPIKWNDQGLIPAIVQDSETGQVLMLAWMNAESLRLTRQTGQTHLEPQPGDLAQGRNERARPGHHRRGLTATPTPLLIQVRPHGPACHTGEISCFFQPISIVRPRE
jgi:phosphoribosyl-AMP cyclohydrolase